MTGITGCQHQQDSRFPAHSMNTWTAQQLLRAWLAPCVLLACPAEATAYLLNIPYSITTGRGAIPSSTCGLTQCRHQTVPALQAQRSMHTRECMRRKRRCWRARVPPPHAAARGSLSGLACVWTAAIDQHQVCLQSVPSALGFYLSILGPHRA